jgi:hypothetical protein
MSVSDAVIRATTFAQVNDAPRFPAESRLGTTDDACE